jgi:MoaA/NifB/PqqE/SkfB family radical SAM enzyme
MINLKMNKVENTKIPISVNYHFTRKCNLKCGFCFHTSKTSYILSPEEAKRGLKLLKNAGMKKINFAGGEPFLYKPFLGELIKYCKEDLKIEKLSIITNGTLVTENFLKTYQKFISEMKESMDNANQKVINFKFGDSMDRITFSEINQLNIQADEILKKLETYDIVNIKKLETENEFLSKEIEISTDIKKINELLKENKIKSISQKDNGFEKTKDIKYVDKKTVIKKVGLGKKPFKTLFKSFFFANKGESILTILLTVLMVLVFSLVFIFLMRYNKFAKK